MTIKVNAASIIELEGDLIKGGSIAIATTDAHLQERLLGDYELSTTIWFNAAVGGVAECIRQISSRGAGSQEALIAKFVDLLKKHLDAGVTDFPGGLNG